MTTLREIRAREAREDAERDAAAASPYPTRATVCQQCGAPAEVTHPDPDHDGEQIGWCGLCEPEDDE